MKADNFRDALISSARRIGIREDDTDEVRLHKQLATGTALMTGLAGIVWGVLYFSFGEWLSGAIPFGYGVIVYILLAIFSITGRQRLFVNLLLILLLLLPFLLMWSLGGFVLGSVAAFWGLLTPLVALLLTTTRQAQRWFFGFLALLVLSFFLEPFLRSSNQLPLFARDLFFVFNVGAPSTVVFVILLHFVTQRDAALALLSHEQVKTERLLLNVLPQEIAQLLKNEDRSIADAFDNVSVLFADVVGFTPLSEQLSPRETVDVLNEIFTHFDGLAEKYNVEKIRTIGDGYMAAAGVPRPHPRHAHALVAMALDMCAYMRERSGDGDPIIRVTQDLQIRIGINSGPAVAGVIGTTKFHYDLWGDAVNISARMESHGVPGKIQIGETTFELIKHEFECVSRGIIDIKGKGEMPTWFVVTGGSR